MRNAECLCARDLPGRGVQYIRGIIEDANEKMCGKRIKDLGNEKRIRRSRREKNKTFSADSDSDGDVQRSGYDSGQE